MSDSSTVRMWDIAVRVFHWTLVAAFATAYITAEEWQTPHTLAGYIITGLVVFRLLWGLVGTRHARFSDFVRSPGEVIAYIKDVLASRPKRYLGHNPAGGAMVIALLIFLALTAVSGMVTYGGAEHAGPFASLTIGWHRSQVHMVKEFHEFCANFTLFLIGLHIIGVIIANKHHGENLVVAMLTGKKRAPQQDTV